MKIEIVLAALLFASVRTQMPTNGKDLASLLEGSYGIKLPAKVTKDLEQIDADESSVDSSKSLRTDVVKPNLDQLYK